MNLADSLVLQMSLLEVDWCHDLDSLFSIISYLILPLTLVYSPYVITPLFFALTPCTLLITRTSILG